jgi:outer membrane protein OmpA-like peptidoglycan-associated protein
MISKNKLSFSLVTILIVLASCSTYKSLNKSQQGAAIGAGGGAVAGGIIGKLTGNTALGALIGAAVGGTTGAVIGHKMDKQAAEIQNEIPNAKVQRVSEGITVEFNNKILFAFNSSQLSSAADTSLNSLVQILNKYPDTNIEVQGHTDTTGTTQYNQTLSEQRAGAVADYILAQGIASNRVTTKGFGALAPEYSNATADGRAGNRRVEFLISANAKMKADAQKESGQ